MSAVMNHPSSRLSRSAAFLWAGVAAVVILMYWDGLSYLFEQWTAKEEYSHGILIPLVAAYLLLQNKAALQRLECRGSWWGVGVVALGLFLFLLGELSTLYILVQYSMLVVLAVLILTFAGLSGLRATWVPLVVLLLMIPLPNFLYQGISAELQLISSKLGVAFIRLFGVSVFLEGNVIDLGAMKLEVAEACNGLRYLFPLLTVSFILAYMYRAPVWIRALIFLSAIPITILMNSFRIGAIGITVDRWGPAMAEGFIHDFEGWVVFMLSMLVLLFEIWLIARLRGDRRALGHLVGLTWPAPSPKGVAVTYRNAPMPFMVGAGLLVFMTTVALMLPARAEITPARDSFTAFPMDIGEWRGRTQRLDQMYIDVLKFDDYLLADYTRNEGRRVNLYAAYYASQRKGESAHSPRSCIPGGGWEITDLTTQRLDGIRAGKSILEVNRVVIQKGEARQLVYYWFQQRGRNITNEYMVKWYLFWDSLTRSRSDGTLIRLTTAVAPGEDMADGDRRLTDFARVSMPELHSFIPE